MRVPFDRARRAVSGPLSNSVGTPPWANRRWKYLGWVRGPMGANQSQGLSGLRVNMFGSAMVPFDRARRVVLGTLANSVGTLLWTNRRWKYFGKLAEKPVFGNFRVKGWVVQVGVGLIR